MKICCFLFLFCLGAAFPAAARMAPPVIAHEPPASVVSGQPFRVVARVHSETSLKEVVLHLAQSGDAAPVKLPLRPAGAGVYATRVPSGLFEDLAEFRYYLSARTEEGVLAETDWVKVRVIRTSVGLKTDEGPGWRRHVLIGAGAAAAVGAGFAIAGGGDGGGEEEDVDPAVDPADQILVRTATGDVDAEAPGLPAVTSVDVAGDLAGRTIRRVRVRLEFDGLDGGEETYEVGYNGATVLTGSAGGSVVEQVDVLGGADTRVVVRVVDSTPVDGTVTYRFTATVTYFLQ